MKKLICLILSVAISSTWAFSQGCLPEGISFQSQTQVDSFQYQNPGCTKIEGSVFINGDVQNLNGLNMLTSIEGDLTIDCVPLIDMSGLDSITHIGGNLGFFDTQFVDMTGLGSLDSIGGSLIIGCETNSSIFCDNPFLINLFGLYDLKVIGGTLLIQHCASLTSLNGLSSLTSTSGITIKSNPGLTTITGLANIEVGSINSLTISNNSSLSQCNVQSICSYLGNPGGEVNIFGNMAGCRNPMEVADSCGITLSCLPYGNYWLNSQSDIDNFGTNYPGCNELGGSVYIIGSDIANLNGLDSVTSIGGSLIIGHEWLGGGNPLLENLEGLENIDTIGGTLHIQYNKLLGNLSGLQNLTSIGGYLQLIGNNGFTNLSGLENLISIGSGLEISGNDGLTNLTGLENATSAGSYILIRLNDELTSLEGLDNIEAASVTDLYIYFNEKLVDCAVQSICDYLVNPSGTVDISSNAPGCDSPEEVEAACNEVSVENIGFENEVLLFPNPADKIVTFSGNNGTSIREIVIYNQTGQKVLQSKHVNNTLDISKLRSGMYVVELVTNQGKARKKLMVE